MVKDRPDAIAWSKGRWVWLLHRLLLADLTEAQLSGNHAPCPLCSGRDRFRFDDKKGMGNYYCNQCGPGDGMDLLQKMNGWSFEEACKQIRGQMYEGAPAPHKPKAAKTGDRLLLNKLWRSAVDARVLCKYLVSRGFDNTVRFVELADLRGIKMLPLWEGKKWIGDYDAMLARITSPAGKPIGLHRTYILPDGTRVKKIMTPTENIRGAAVRLGKAAELMVIGEGIETTLAGMRMFNAPGWAGISALGLRSMVLPKVCKRVIILADNDVSFTGQSAAYGRARVAKKDGLEHVEVFVPPVVGADALDCWLGMRGAKS